MRSPPAILLLAGVVAYCMLAGCGGDKAASEPATNRHAEGSSEYTLTAADERAYIEELRGLRQAAIADADYNALSRAKQLAAPQKAVIEAFCHFAWQIGVNREADVLNSHEYLVGRITNSAEVDFPPVDDSPIRPAIGQLRRVIALNRLNADLVARYRRACES